MHYFVFFIIFALVEIQFISNYYKPMFFKVIIFGFEVAVAFCSDKIFICMIHIAKTFNDI